jgi:cytochrome c oxidase subunit 2
MRSAGRLVPALLLFLAACGDGGNPTSTLAERGRTLYKEQGCAGCHTVDGTRLVGPTWKGLYGSEVELADGSTVEADEEYLKESILQPSAKTVAGFQPGLMETVIKPNSLSEDEVDALVAYIKELGLTRG